MLVYSYNMLRLTLPLLLVLAAPAAEVKLGEPLSAGEPIPIKTLLSSPASYVDKTVQVKGKITEVCLMMGCWMMLHDGAGSAVRIKVNDGEIVFPKDSPGREAIAEGKFVRFELSKEQAIAGAKHEAEEMGNKFDPSSVKGPQVVYQVQGSGAVLLD